MNETSRLMLTLAVMCAAGGLVWVAATYPNPRLPWARFVVYAWALAATLLALGAQYGRFAA